MQIRFLGYLDDNQGPTVRDYSRNGNHGTVFGASPAVGRIDGALSFDDINDYIDLGNDRSLHVLENFTIEFNLTMPNGTPWEPILTTTTIADEAVKGWKIRRANNNRIYFLAQCVGGNIQSGVPFYTPTVNHHWCARYNAVGISMFLDGVESAGGANAGLVKDFSANVTAMAYADPGSMQAGILDHLIIYNRPLLHADILRHSLRRWPT